MSTSNAIQLLERRSMLSASMSGEIVVDFNGNGSEDPGDTYLAGVTVYNDANNNAQLDPGEAATTTNALGVYKFPSLSGGDYHFRQVLPAGYSQTDPAGGGAIDITLHEGDAGDEDFADHPTSPVGFIRGSIFNDLNADQKQEAGEGYLSGWTAYIDSNKDGSFEAGEPTSTTDSTGYFTFQTLPPGDYHVGEIVKSGWQQTRPTTGIYDVNVSGGQVVFDRIFGDRLNETPPPPPPPPPPTTGSISGNVFNDTNSSGLRDAGEAGLGGWTVYIDSNKNNQLDGGDISTLTNGEGNYSFSGLTAGDYHIREVKPDGWREVKPTESSYFDVNLLAGQNAAGFGFANTQKVVLIGEAFNDANGNGNLDPGEAGQAQVTVYLDTNNNGQLDPGESRLQTNSAGLYAFLVDAGSYHIREVTPAGMHRTAPSAGVYDVTLTGGQSAAGRNFGNALGAPPVQMFNTVVPITRFGDVQRAITLI